MKNFQPHEFACNDGCGGGSWAYGAEAGARCVNLDDAPWVVGSYDGVRAVCDSL